MTTSPLDLPRTPTAEGTARVVPERRQHRRVNLTLLGRFMRANKQEYPCRLNDISVSAASMMAPVTVELGERIVAYYDRIGGIEGTVARVFDGGFAIDIVASQHKREKLAAQLTWILNKDELGLADVRRHDRIALRDKTSILKLEEGGDVECQVLDVSLSGASVGTSARPRVGSRVVVGKLRAQVVRHHETGIGVEFIDIQEPEALRRHFG